MQNPGPLDPRFAFRTPAQAFNPRARAIAFQAGNFPDQRQLEAVARQVGTTPAQIADIIDRLRARSSTPALSNILWLAILPFVQTSNATQTFVPPQILVPRNHRRLFLSLACITLNSDEQPFFSYDAPVSGMPGGFTFPVPIGIPLEPGFFGTPPTRAFPRSFPPQVAAASPVNGTISINDIWVWSFTFGPVGQARAFFAWEGGLEVSGNAG
jgi:hypothetical protein